MTSKLELTDFLQRKTLKYENIFRFVKRAKKKEEENQTVTCVSPAAYLS